MLIELASVSAADICIEQLNRKKWTVAGRKAMLFAEYLSHCEMKSRFPLALHTLAAHKSEVC